MRERLQQICEPIWGKHWQTPLAKHLNVSTRTIRRWCSGKKSRPLPCLLEAIEAIKGNRRR